MKTYNRLIDVIEKRGAAHLILVDPDKINEAEAGQFIAMCNDAGVDGFLAGGSLMMNSRFDDFIKTIKENTSKPVIVFPGAVTQVSPLADALFFLSVISGRNAEHLIGKHVIAAPIIKNAGVEPISVGYMLIESGGTTTAQYMSGSLPIPRNKPEIAAATALAAEYLGFKFVYLEAGSGAEKPVPAEMIKAVSEYVTIPVIAGGGIKSPEAARQRVNSGAKIIVTGNFFENRDNWNLVKEFADAVHIK